MALTLVIGNKNYSSWSMRPWMALKGTGITFDEIVIPLYTGDADKQRILDVTRSGKVPALVDGDITVWDSLAIIEYAAERFPDARLWPQDVVARAHARSISAEMHSGFMALRNECGMNIHRPIRSKPLSDDARANIARIRHLDRMPGPVRRAGAISVRRLQRCGCDVCAGCPSVPNLCHRCDAAGARLYGYDAGECSFP